MPTDFTFLIYTLKYIYLKKYPFFNANLLEKFDASGTWSIKYLTLFPAGLSKIY